VTMPMRMSSRLSSSSSASTMACDMASVAAFLASGRFSVMIWTPSFTSTIRSDMEVSSYFLGSARGHADGAIQTDGLAVHITVLQYMSCQFTELFRRAKACGVGHRATQRLAHVFRQAGKQRSVENSGCNGVHANVLGGQVAGCHDGHADDACLGRIRGDLADLDFESG